MDYDIEEAAALLGAAKERGLPDANARHKAAMALVDALKSAATKARLHADYNSNGALFVKLSPSDKRSAYVMVDGKDGTISVTDSLTAPGTKLDLAYSPAIDMLVSTSVDEDHHPKPGDRVDKPRSALADLVAAVLDTLKLAPKS